MKCPWTHSRFFRPPPHRAFWITPTSQGKNAEVTHPFPAFIAWEVHVVINYLWCWICSLLLPKPSTTSISHASVVISLWKPDTTASTEDPSQHHLSAPSVNPVHGCWVTLLPKEGAAAVGREGGGHEIGHESCSWLLGAAQLVSCRNSTRTDPSFPPSILPVTHWAPVGGAHSWQLRREVTWRAYSQGAGSHTWMR